MKVRALHVPVYTHPTFRKCANGGATETFDDIFVLCPDGPFEIEDDAPDLFEIVRHIDTIHLEQCTAPDDGRLVGPMFGGNYAASSDARFNWLCREKLGRRFYGAVAVHDRFETPEMYEALSR